MDRGCDTCFDIFHFRTLLHADVLTFKAQESRIGECKSVVGRFTSCFSQIKCTALRCTLVLLDGPTSWRENCPWT